ncbi:isochorismatase family protein [Aminithiophilus ramosus]|uniref:Isochorismatase family protein n=1 Tax=Aminithiophilus ramosus TaxID=3029084 RepID=A0A9Q7EXW3_9BACT|nr:isochorismatase family protein [Aminithiophilus ramosus]QTX31376.1 isochorismatase family protein [Aminithiophilus ramosus]
MRPFIIDAEKAILLVVDVQEKLIPLVADSETVENRIAILARAAEMLHLPVKMTEQYPRGLGSTTEPVASSLSREWRRFEKTHFSCYAEEGFAEYLSEPGRDQIIVCGVEAHICVLATVMELLERDYRVIVAADAVSSRQEEHRNLALDAMSRAGALVVPMETVVYQMLKRSGTVPFKALLAYFR